MLGEITFSVKNFATFFTCEFLCLSVDVHVMMQTAIVTEHLATLFTFVNLCSSVKVQVAGETALPVKTLPTVITHKGLSLGMNHLMSDESTICGKTFPTLLTLVLFATMNCRMFFQLLLTNKQLLTLLTDMYGHSSMIQ